MRTTYRCPPALVALLALAFAGRAGADRGPEEEDSRWLEVSLSGDGLVIVGLADEKNGTRVRLAVELDGRPVFETRVGRVRDGRFQERFAFGAARLLPGRYAVRATLETAAQPTACTSFRVGTPTEEAESRAAYATWLQASQEGATRLDGELAAYCRAGGAAPLPEDWASRYRDLRADVSGATAGGRYVALYEPERLQWLLTILAGLNARVALVREGKQAVAGGDRDAAQRACPDAPLAGEGRTSPAPWYRPAPGGWGTPLAGRRDAADRAALGERFRPVSAVLAACLRDSTPGGRATRWVAARHAVEDLAADLESGDCPQEVSVRLCAAQACLTELETLETAASPSLSPERRAERRAYLRGTLAETLGRIERMFGEEGGSR
ncbi:MAG: hypothetical protein HYZ53_09755 [Planctomycetes bacterium]|nr:hypothetical protein [Planctomycetota bacterium]